jgi:hypothetical protein
MLRSEGRLSLTCLAVAVYSKCVYDYACTSWQMVHAQRNMIDLYCYAPALFVWVCVPKGCPCYCQSAEKILRAQLVKLQES